LYLTHNCQVHERQGKTEIQRAEIRETITTKYDMGSWIGSWNRKGTLMEKLVKAE
jgi:hypothetical protein